MATYCKSLCKHDTWVFFWISQVVTTTMTNLPKSKIVTNLKNPLPMIFSPRSIGWSRWWFMVKNAICKPCLGPMGILFCGNGLFAQPHSSQRTICTRGALQETFFHCPSWENVAPLSPWSKACAASDIFTASTLSFMDTGFPQLNSEHGIDHRSLSTITHSATLSRFKSIIHGSF